MSSDVDTIMVGTVALKYPVMIEWINNIYPQPPGLMQMRLMHHWSMIKGTEHFISTHDVVCHPHDVILSHAQLILGVFRRRKQGRVPIPHALHHASWHHAPWHGRTLQHKVPMTMP